MPLAARQTDISMCPSDSHGNLCCSHIVAGQPLLRANGTDNGVHSSCCGANTWVTMQGSSTVTVNDMPVVRLGDTTTHCGGTGSIITGASNVNVGG